MRLEEEVRAGPPPRAVAAATDEDQRLLAAMARHDRRALATFYARHCDRLLRAASRLVRDPEEARDLVHDVVLEVWRLAGTYDPARAGVTAWLTMLLRCRALDRLRSRRALGHATRRKRATAQAGATAAALPLADAIALRRACRALPARDRELLGLAYQRGLTCTEIARVLDMPVGTMKWRMAVVLRELRRVIASE